MHADQYALSADACRSVCPFSRCMQISMPFQQMHVDQHAFFAPLPLLTILTNMCPVLQSALQSAEEYAREMQQMEWPTHPPGRILHIVEEEEST